MTKRVKDNLASIWAVGGIKGKLYYDLMKR
jgi:hypothetical protein